MNALLTVLSLVVLTGIALFVPDVGATAILLCAILAWGVAVVIHRVRSDRTFLLQLFVIGLMVRLLVGTAIFVLHLQEFFGGDARTYDEQGYAILRLWQGHGVYGGTPVDSTVVWGMPYLVAAIYALTGRNPLAVQFVNAVIGAATASATYVCAQHIFHNARVARATAVLVALFPSLVLWSSQGLKDAPIIFLLAISMLATLKLGERLSVKYIAILSLSLLGLLSLRFYVFYLMVAAVGGSFVIGMQQVNAQSLARQVVIIAAVGLGLTYFGVLRTASSQFEAFGSLETVQRSRSDLVGSAASGFGKDVDVSTTSGALSAIPLGMVFLLFAPFPWQLASLRQSITLPEMIVWWGCFPLLVLGLWFTLKYRLRQALPILIFTTMLTLAYSIFQGNVGTAYRQRSQLLVFYFIFVAVGYELLRERREDRRQRDLLERQLATAGRGQAQKI